MPLTPGGGRFNVCTLLNRHVEVILNKYMKVLTVENQSEMFEGHRYKLSLIFLKLAVELNCIELEVC